MVLIIIVMNGRKEDLKTSNITFLEFRTFVGLMFLKYDQRQTDAYL
jgi:hypothetical protein